MWRAFERVDADPREAVDEVEGTRPRRAIEDVGERAVDGRAEVVAALLGWADEVRDDPADPGDAGVEAGVDPRASAALDGLREAELGARRVGALREQRRERGVEEGHPREPAREGEVGELGRAESEGAGGEVGERRPCCGEGAAS